MAKMTDKQRLWKVFAVFIKLRDSPNGYVNCISCGRMLAYPNSKGNVDAGHFYARSIVYAGLYFNEINVQSQCVHCNRYLEGNAQGFSKGLIKKYGPDVLEELENKRLTGPKKYYPFEYEAMIKDYRARVKKMKKDRGIS